MKLHVISVQCEYGKTAYKVDVISFFKILNLLGCSVYNDSDTNFEIELNEYRRAMQAMKNIAHYGKDLPLSILKDDDFFLTQDDVLAVIDIVKTKFKPLTLNDVFHCMERYWEEKDKNSDWIQFCVF